MGPQLCHHHYAININKVSSFWPFGQTKIKLCSTQPLPHRSLPLLGLLQQTSRIKTNNGQLSAQFVRCSGLSCTPNSHLPHTFPIKYLQQTFRLLPIEIFRAKTESNGSKRNNRSSSDVSVVASGCACAYACAWARFNILV